MSLSLRVVRHDKHVTSHTKILTASCWTDNYRELVGIDFLDNTPFDGGGQGRIIRHFAAIESDDGRRWEDGCRHENDSLGR
jgi:hypothetical protein